MAEKKLIALCALVAQAMRMTREEAHRCGQSWLKNPLHPLLIRKRKDGKYDVVDGSNRVHGARMVLGEDSAHEVPCEEVSSDVSDEEIFLISAIRKEPTAQEQVRKVERLSEIHPDWRGKEFAEALHLDPGHTSRLLKVSKAIPVWREAFFDGQVNLEKIAEAGGKPDHEQHVMFAKLMECQKNKPKGRSATNRLDGSQNDEKGLKRVKVELGGGLSVVVCGEKLTLESAGKATVEASKVFERGKKEGLSPQNLQRVSAEWAAAEAKKKPKGGAEG